MEKEQDEKQKEKIKRDISFESREVKYNFETIGR